jgi:hypothetical protein
MNILDVCNQEVDEEEEQMQKDSIREKIQSIGRTMWMLKSIRYCGVFPSFFLKYVIHNYFNLKNNITDIFLSERNVNQVLNLPISWKRNTLKVRFSRFLILLFSFHDPK